jgi:hypothetical protein
VIALSALATAFCKVGMVRAAAVLFIDPDPNMPEAGQKTVDAAFTPIDEGLNLMHAAFYPIDGVPTRTHGVKSRIEGF